MFKSGRRQRGHGEVARGIEHRTQLNRHANQHEIRQHDGRKPQEQIEPRRAAPDDPNQPKQQFTQGYQPDHKKRPTASLRRSTTAEPAWGRSRHGPSARADSWPTAPLRRTTGETGLECERRTKKRRPLRPCPATPSRAAVAMSRNIPKMRQTCVPKLVTTVPAIRGCRFEAGFMKTIVSEFKTRK